MEGGKAARHPTTGCHLNTQGLECAACYGDLSLSALVSGALPGR